MSRLIYPTVSLVILAFCVIFVQGATIIQHNKFLSHKIESLSTEEKLSLVRKLSKEKGFPQVELAPEDVCLEEGCIEAALYLLESMNTSVDPCKNFFEFSCGGWKEKNPIPPSSFVIAPFMVLIEKVNNITQEILREPKDYENDPLHLNLAKDFFHSCEDVEERERQGLEPLRRLIAQFGGWQLINPESWNASGFDWLKAIAETGRRNLKPTLINPMVLLDHKDTDHYQIMLDQPNLGLPRDILINSENFAPIINAYQTFIVEVAKELGSTLSEDQLKAEAKSIIEFEIKLANISAPAEGRFNMSLIYNPFSIPDFQSLTDSIDADFHIDWKAYLDQVFSSSGTTISPNERIIVYQVEYIKKLLPLIKDELDKPTLANYIVWRVVSAMASETNAAMRDINFRFIQSLTGQTEQTTLNVGCADTTNYFMGMALGAKYVDRNFDEESKDEMYRMVDNLMSTFKEMVRGADWMLEETKQEAISKADAMRTFMAYPDWIYNNTAVENYFKGFNYTMDQGHFENYLYGLESSVEGVRRDYRDKVDKDQWIAHPGTVNAYNFFEFNAIIFPAGFLQPPYFGGNRPKHQNYAGIGMVIGHEITHGFDDRGAQYDRNGNAENWWDPDTKEEFERRGRCMIDQYGGYYAEAANMTLNGVTTLGENIGDNGGLREAYKAYQKYVDINGPELRLPGLESFSIDQLFFLGFANIWCESITPEGLVTTILTDVHSPSEFRVLGPLKNFNKFAEAYNCPVDKDGMNPPQEDKCIVW